MSKDVLQARRWGRVMAAASLGGTVLALAAWCSLGAAAGATVYGGFVVIFAMALILRVGFRSFATALGAHPALGAHQAPQGVLGGRKAPR
jgi:hypothetical protein